jgi:hypothetical protein
MAKIGENSVAFQTISAERWHPTVTNAECAPKDKAKIRRKYAKECLVVLIDRISPPKISMVDR